MEKLKIDGFVYAYDHGRIRKREIVSIEDHVEYYEIKCKRCRPYRAHKYCLDHYGCFWSNSQKLFLDKDALVDWLNKTHKEHNRLYSKYARLSWRYWNALKHIEEAMMEL